MFRRSLVALLALLAAACAMQCGTETVGSTNGYPVHLKTVQMYPDFSYWEVKVPEVCDPSTQIIGTTVQACDVDSPPRVTMYSLLYGTVHRTGSTSETGLIRTTVYCGSAWNSLPQGALGRGVQPRSQPSQTLAFPKTD